MSDTIGEWFQGHGGRRLWRLRREVADPIGGVLLNHGYGEHSGRYLHVIDGLADRGFTVLAPDHRGHGRSARLLGDLESLDAILGDQARLGDALEAMVPGRPLFVVAHSMGALLSLLVLAREPRWAGAVLNGTPLSIPDRVSPRAVRLARLLGRAAPWMPIQSFYDPTRASRDPEVAARIAADPLQYKGRIRAGTGMIVLDALRRADAALPGLRLPVLVTHGGADRTVDPATSARLHARLGSADKELHVFDGLLHEVHQEPERDAVIGRWGTWLRRHARDADKGTS